jgi:transitional endoplasmic reticulum ATPase
MDPLDDLLTALEASPGSLALRTHVVRELLKGRRWKQDDSAALPLESTPQRPLRRLAQARLAIHDGKTELARGFYQEAIESDRGLIDEALEAQLEPSTPLQIPTTVSDEKEAPVRADRPKTSFADIGGMEQLKKQIRLSILMPMQRPEIYEAYGKKIGGGIMMYGPPGCGKTHLARATAGEMGANFYMLELQDILSKWVGETEKAISNLFETARATAPSVIFVDEVDALGAKRSDMGSAALRWSVSQFLVEMDGMSSQNSKVLVLGATNAPWNVDSAMRRPGRFERVLFVPPPDLESRSQILEIHSRNRKMDSRVDFKDLAKRTEFFSGADLANLVERATERAVEEALLHGTMRSVDGKDFAAALKECKASTMEWLRRSRNYVNFANQDGIYDDLATYLDKAKIR